VNVRARRFPLFDSLRAIAAIFVVTRHGLDQTPAVDPISTIYPPVMAMGVLALAMFFVISAFLLYRPFLAAHVAGTKRTGFWAYALGRGLRIFPAYWLALTVIVIWLDKPYVFTQDWWQFYLLVYDYFGYALGGVGPAWSLCIELAYYVFLPFFVLFVARLPGATPEARLRWSAIACGVVTAVGLASRIYFTERAKTGGVSADIIPPAFLDWLGFGMLLAVFSVWLERRDERLPGPLRHLDRFPVLAWAVALVLFVVDSLLIRDQPIVFGSPETWQVHVLGGLAALAIVVPGAIGSHERGLVRRLLANRVLLFLGLVSYGIFLWHMAVIEQLDAWNLERIGFVSPYVLWPVVALIGSTAIATVSYYALERPAMGLRKRILRRRTPVGPRGEALAEPAPAAPLPVRDAPSR
jgi:peptidoglycan/LPS O-acetylase OafA/YrhL